MPKRLCAVALAAAVLVQPAWAAEEPKQVPCSGPEYRELDFWVGTWNATWGKAGKGRNVIARTLGDCVIEERFTSFAGERPLIGMSVSMYSAKAGGWRQTWVDNSGGYLPFTGGPSDEGFKFDLVRASDKDPYKRMIWKNVTKQSFDWHWQASKDGKTWEDKWVIHYQRTK